MFYSRAYGNYKLRRAAIKDKQRTIKKFNARPDSLKVHPGEIPMLENTWLTIFIDFVQELYLLFISKKHNF